MPISGRVKTELSIDSILERVTELQIFQHFILDKNWRLNEIMCSPLRKDENPSFLVGNRYGTINFKDFSISEHKGDCFQFVKILHNLPTLDSVLRLIDSSMGLGIGNGSEMRSSPIIVPDKPIEVTKRNSLIQVITKPFTKGELKYWSDYYQDITDLRRENIYSIKKAYLNKKLLSLDELRFAYFYPEHGFKIYQPLSDKRKKWLSNIPLTVLDGEENIKNCDVAWLTKSKKDKMCLLKLFSCVASTQNESLACFSKDNVEFIKNNSKKQVVLYDSDDAGVKSCQEITKKFSFSYCNPPRKYLPEIKDFSDLLRTHGIKALEEALKIKNLI
jgi:hypothetical protein